MSEHKLFAGVHKVRGSRERNVLADLRGVRAPRHAAIDPLHCVRAGTT